MGEISGVPACLFRLFLAVREQLIDLLGQRPDLRGEVAADPSLIARADRSHFAPHPS